MSKIFVGIPSVRNDQAFLESMNEFLPDIGKLHEVKALEVRDKKIDEARNFIVDEFLKSDSEYLLFLDDDHSGHTVEMLQTLLDINSYVSAIKCYSRFFPYLANLMDYSGSDDPRIKYKPKDVTVGIHPCDLVGFGMTLIKRATFDLLSRPYFVAINNGKEDNYFCDSLIKIGIKPMGCFDYTLPHQGIDQYNAEKMKKEGLDKIFKNFKDKFPNQEVDKLDMLIIV